MKTTPPLRRTHTRQCTATAGPDKYGNRRLILESHKPKWNSLGIRAGNRTPPPPHTALRQAGSAAGKGAHRALHQASRLVRAPSMGTRGEGYGSTPRDCAYHGDRRHQADQSVQCLELARLNGVSRVCDVAPGGESALFAQFFGGAFDDEPGDSRSDASEDVVTVSVFDDACWPSGEF